MARCVALVVQLCFELEVMVFKGQLKAIGGGGGGGSTPTNLVIGARGDSSSFDSRV